METFYAPEQLRRTRPAPLLFLAGPTPRSATTPSWRPAALDHLEAVGFAGSVAVPEDRSGVFRADYTDQVAWEWTALETAEAIVFWVPRSLPAMPAFTTNVEFGLWARSGKVVLGAPPDAEKVRYLLWVAEQLGIPTASTLGETLDAGVALAQRRRATFTQQPTQPR